MLLLYVPASCWPGELGLYSLRRSLTQYQLTQRQWEELSSRRKLWQAVLENDGWTGQELHQAKQQRSLDLGSIPYAT